MSEHATLPPSSADEWSQCGRWLETTTKALSILPDTPTDETLEGDASHEVAAAVLSSYKSGEHVLLKSDFLGRDASNGVILTDEMIDAAMVYVNAVLKDVGGNLSRMVVEQRVYMQNTINPKNYGTPDCYWFDSSTFTIKLYDYKYGHSGVNAYENWQGINYVAGIVEGFANQIDDTKVNVEINIVQPRRYDGTGPVRTWRVKLSDLRAHFNVLRSAAERNLSDTGEHNVGKHCTHCVGRLVCEKFIQWEARQVDVAGQSLPYTLTTELADYQLSKLDDTMKLLTKKREVLEAFALNAIERGETFQSRELVKTLARANEYKLSPQQVINFGDMLGVNLRKPTSPVPPKEAEKIVKSAGMSPDVLNQLYHRPVTGTKLKQRDHTVTRELFSR